MLKLFTSNHDELTVIFDIGNGSVGVSLVSLIPGKPPVISYSYREAIAPSADIDSQRLLQSMLGLLKNVAEKLQKEGLHHVRHTLLGKASLGTVHCILSSPWFVSKTVVLSSKTETPTAITEKFVKELVTKELEVQKTALKGSAYDQQFGSELITLEQNIIHTKLNGYEIAMPFGKNAHDTEFTVYLSFISKTILDQAEAVLHKIFNYRKIQFNSFALASWTAIGPIFPDNHHFLFADITNEVTDISITHHAVLSDTAFFQKGRSTLIREVVKELNVAPEVALSFLSMHFSGSIEAGFTDKIKIVLKKVGDEWFNSLGEKVKELTKKHPMPKSFFITVDPDLATFFVDVLKRQLPLEFTVPQNAFEIVVLDSEKMSLFVNHSEGVKKDPFLALESLFLTYSLKK